MNRLAPSRVPFALYALCALIGALGCTAGEPEETRNSGGTTAETATAPAPSGDTHTLALQARVGVLDGDERYELGRVMQVAIGRDNAFIIADDATPALRVFDSTGTFVRVIYRLGSGPGEYRSMGGVRTLPEGRIVLWDNRLRRLTTYSDTGAVLASREVPSGLFSADLLQVEHNGTAWVRTMLVSLDAPNPLIGRRFEAAWIRVSPDGMVMDTILVPRLRDQAEDFVLWSASGYSRPFTHEAPSAVTVLGEVVSGDNARYAFERRVPGGILSRTERAHTPVRLGTGERAEWEGWARQVYEQARARPANPREIRATPPPNAPVRIPSVKPAFKALVGDADGRVWVHRYVAADSLPAQERAAGDTRPRRVWLEPSTFDVFDPDGTWWATVTLPQKTRFADARGEELWVIGSGEIGEDFVARYRLVPVSAAPH